MIFFLITRAVLVSVRNVDKTLRTDAQISQKISKNIFEKIKKALDFSFTI